MKNTTEISFAAVASQKGRLAVIRPNHSFQLKKAMSLTMALILSLLLCLTATKQVNAQTPAPAYIPLNADQLDQVVAPIALDPDSLIAQILTASTYPDQVGAADTWSNQNISLPADQRASGADAMPWDPAIKGLIAFPDVLDNLAKNAAWTAQLGNAYFNQPDDVMNAIQALRAQAQQANVLVTTPHERVVLAAGQINIVPVDPAVVYVPYYNPWHIWGSLFVAYPGYVIAPAPFGVVAVDGIAFEPPVAVAAYGVFGWGFAAWTPAWTSGAVFFNHSTYISNSVTVINHGHFGGHDAGAFEHGGHGVPNGYHAGAHAGNGGRMASGKTQGGHGGSSYGHSANGHSANGHTANSHATNAHATNARTANKGGSRTTSGSHSTNSASNRSRNTSTRSQSSHSANNSRSTRTSHAANSHSGSTTHAQARTSRSTGTSHSARSVNTNRAQARNARTSTTNRSASRNTRSSGMNNRSQARTSRSSSTGNRGMGGRGTSSGARTRNVASHQSMGARSSGGRSGGRRR